MEMDSPPLSQEPVLKNMAQTQGGREADLGSQAEDKNPIISDGEGTEGMLIG